MLSPRLTPPIAKRLLGMSASLLLATCLVACGGGGTSTASNGSGIGSGGTGSFTTGPISGFGSIIVNGIRYDDSGVTPTSQDGEATPELKLGMVIDVEGGATSQVTQASGEVQTIAKANTVKVGFELLGPMNPALIDTTKGTLEVLGQEVQVTVDTFFEPDADLSGLKANGQCAHVKVYGFPRTSGSYTATRIECVLTPPTAFRVRGRVDAVGGGLVTINGQAYRLEGQAQTPTVGQVVRAVLRNDASNTVLSAATETRVTSKPQEARAEGMVTSYVAASGTLSLNGVPVKLDSSTTLRPANLDLGSANLRVSVRGRLVDGVLMATWVEQESARYVPPGLANGGNGGANSVVTGDREIVLHGRVTRLDTQLKCFSTRGVRVCYASTDTRFVGGQEADLAGAPNGPGAHVEVKGVRSSAGGDAIVAQEIRFIKD